MGPEWNNVCLPLAKQHVCRTFMCHIKVSYYFKATDEKKMVTRFVVNYYILPIDGNAVARQNVVITTFCNVTTFWVATMHRFNHILLRLQLDTNLFELCMYNFQSTLHQDITLRYLSLRFNESGDIKTL